MDNPQNSQIGPPADSKAHTAWRRWRLLIFGFLGWFLFEGLVYLLIKPDSEEEIIFGNCLPFLITLSALIIFALNKPTRQVALGILAAVAVNLVISLIKGLAVNGFCFIPFYVK